MAVAEVSTAAGFMVAAAGFMAAHFAVDSAGFMAAGFVAADLTGADSAVVLPALAFIPIPITTTTVTTGSLLPRFGITVPIPWDIIRT
jgi:hypothetical protein